MKTLNFIGALSLGCMALATEAKANLVFADFVQPSSDPAQQAAILENEFKTGPLIFLGLYNQDEATGAVTFVPGAITDMSQISFSPSPPHNGFVSWNLDGTDLRMRFALATVSGSDYTASLAYSVTSDERLRSFGLQPSNGTFAGSGEFLDQVSFFGSRAGVPDAGSTALLLGSAIATLTVLRRAFIL